MDSIDLEKLERRARGGYERARIGWSLAGMVPVLLVIIAAALLGKRPSSAALFGGALFATGTMVLWRGGELRLALWPGVLSGLIPLTCALIANHTHICAGGHCTTMCLPACSAGGIVAGLAVSFIATRRNLSWGFWAAASAVSLLTGAMGCSCIGYAGVVGLVAGFSLGLMPQLLRRLLSSR